MLFQINNIESRITECWYLVNEESIFFLNFASWRGQSYSFMIGPQIALQQLIQLRSCFSVTMASHLEIVDEEYIIKELKGKSEKESTKNSTEL